LILDRNKIQKIQQACSIVGRKKTLNVFSCENKQNATMPSMVELKDTTPSQCH
jgi:hypothetical protein